MNVLVAMLQTALVVALMLMLVNTVRMVLDLMWQLILVAMHAQQFQSACNALIQII